MHRTCCVDDVKYSEIENLRNCIFEEIRNLLEIDKNDDFLFMEEESEALSNLEFALEDLTKISWIYFSDETAMMLLHSEELEKIGYFYKMLFELAIQRSTRLRLPAYKFFEDYNWVDLYKAVFTPFRKNGLSKISSIRERKKTTVLPYFQKNIEEIVRLHKKKKGFDQLSIEQLKHLTMFLCEFFDYDLAYFEVDFDEGFIGNLMEEIIAILNVRNHEPLLRYIMAEVMMNIFDFDNDEI